MYEILQDKETQSTGGSNGKSMRKTTLSWMSMFVDGYSLLTKDK
jgi:hypothetical protein